MQPMSHYAPIYNTIPSSSYLMDQRITQCEIRYCHINGALADFGLTLAARLSFLTTQAAHHHFIILTLECGALIYIDKHSYRNIIIRNDKDGLNGGGDEWLSSESLKCYSMTDRGILLSTVID